ncbi:phosphate ABC transporter ATP-binding protein [Nitrospira sp. M1]
MSSTRKSPTPHTEPSHSTRNIAPCCDPDPLIQTRNLSLSYGNHQAIRNISLTIHRGCLTAIVGPSGSGKSSFLQCLNRLTDLLPECTVSGQATIENLDILSPTIDVLQLRRRIGMIFQKPNPFPMSIQKNLEFPLKEHGVTAKHLIQERAQQALMDVGLWNEVKDRMDTSALRLSGGQQQRLCMARALVLSPDVLLMDEPCSALDPLSSGTVEDLIFSLRGQYTIIIVTHNLAQAYRIADYVGMFWNQTQAGELIEFGPTHAIFEHPQQNLTAAYINGIRW